ncbi:MAG: tetratricopeptide repeat protein [Symbiopectobacterium sp.]
MDAWNNLGIIAQECGNLTFSESCMPKVLTANPDNPQAHNNLANTLRRLGQSQQALHHYQQALAHDPPGAGARPTLLNFADLAMLQRPEEANRWLEELRAFARAGCDVRYGAVRRGDCRLSSASARSFCRRLPKVAMPRWKLC